MIDKNMSYVMSGAKILKLLELIDDLKHVAIEYAEETDDDVEKIENNYETLMDASSSSTITHVHSLP